MVGDAVSRNRSAKTSFHLFRLLLSVKVFADPFRETASATTKSAQIDVISSVTE